MKIELPPTNLLRQRITKKNNMFIEIFDSHIHYLVDFKCQEPMSDEDEQMPWIDTEQFLEVIFKKSFVVAIEICSVAQKEEVTKWKVSTCCYGMAQDISMYFDKKEEAQSLYKALTKWFHNSQHAG